MTDTLPKLSVDKARPGIIRMEGEDEFTGILAGIKAAEIVRRCNAYPDLLAALEEIIARNEIQHWFNLDQARAAVAKAKTL